jgi:chromosome segregation ATPase
MDERLVKRLHEQLTEANTRNGQLIQQVESLEKAKEEARAIRAGLSFVEQERNKALAAKAAAEKTASEARNRQREAEREASRARNELQRERRLLAAVRADAARLSAVNSLIANAQHVDDLFTTNEVQE